MDEPEVGWDLDPQVASWPGLPTVAEDLRADVCVVGLGGSGLAAIGELLRRGLSVIGLDAGRVAAGAAGRNGGFLLGGPAIGVHKAAAGWGIEAALETYRQSLHEISELRGLLGESVIRPVGSLRLAGLPGPVRDEAEAADRERELADCREQLQVMAAHSIAAEWYSGPLGEGLYLPDDAAMNPARRALGMALRYGATASLFENSPVVSALLGVDAAFDRWRRRRQNHWKAADMAAHDRHVARIVEDTVLLLVGGVVLLIHDNQAKLLERKEQGRAGAGHNAHGAFRHLPPDPFAHPRRQV